MSAKCCDRVVGDILAGWRYDISGIVPEMRGDYEAHFAACEHCRSRRQLHRTIDIALIVLTALSAVIFLVAFAAVYHFEPRHAFTLELVALAGFLLSVVIWLAVAVATPAPLVVAGAARRVQNRLPDPIKERVRSR